MDTTFEFDLMNRANSISEYQNLVAENDNQPILHRYLPWMLYHLTGQSSELTRALTALLYVLLLLLIFHWYMTTLEKSGRLNRTTLGFSLRKLLFAFFITTSPAVMITLALLRYSSMMTVIWFLVVLLVSRTIALSDKTESKYVTIAGLISGLAYLVSYTSLALTISVILILLLYRRNLVSKYLLTMTPGLVLAGLWIIFAGPQFRDKVFSKSAMPLSRQIGALWENTVWVWVGPANLPSIFLAILMSISAAGLLVSRRLFVTVERNQFALITIQMVVPILVFSFAGLANGNMAGPSLTTFGLVLAKMRSNLTRSKSAYLGLGLIFITITSASLSTLMNFNVLRPYYYSNQVLEVKKTILSMAESKRLILLSYADLNADLALGKIDNLEVIRSPKDIQTSIQTAKYVLTSSETDKSNQLVSLKVSLDSRGLKLKPIEDFGPYTQSSIRAALNMFNISGHQYSLFEIVQH